MPLREALRVPWRSIVARAARTYAAGPELADALRVCHRLSDRGFAGTIGFWNRDDDSPRRVADAYLAALDALARKDLDCYLSVKAPSLGFDGGLLAEVLEHARRGDAGVHFDSLGPETAAKTFGLLAAARAHSARLGCTLPGRWRRSLRDADEAAELGLSVRVVKGQWSEWNRSEDEDLRGGFLKVVDRLAGRVSHVAVATHDAPLAREALKRLAALGTPCAVELLFGLPARPAIREAALAGVPVRFYVPYGHAWLPYSLSRVRKNPRILLWILRDALAGCSSRWISALKES